MPRQETSRYYERCLRQIEQLCVMLDEQEKRGEEDPILNRRIYDQAKLMQEERQHANNS